MIIVSISTELDAFRYIEHTPAYSNRKNPVKTLQAGTCTKVIYVFIQSVRIMAVTII